LRAQLTREGKLTNEQFDQLDKRAKKIALDSVKFAEESPDPPLEKLYDYTYVNGAMESGRPRPVEPAQERREGAPSPEKAKP
jgi:TPP-dependent pyruvate/acetoin dehydrogenase alpha subunit